MVSAGYISASLTVYLDDR